MELATPCKTSGGEGSQPSQPGQRIDFSGVFQDKASAELRAAKLAMIDECAPYIMQVSGGRGGDVCLHVLVRNMELDGCTHALVWINVISQ